MQVFQNFLKTVGEKEVQKNTRVQKKREYIIIIYISCNLSFVFVRSCVRSSLIRVEKISIFECKQKKVNENKIQLMVSSSSSSYLSARTFMQKKTRFYIQFFVSV